MKFVLAGLLLLSLVCCRDYLAMEINEMDSDDLNEFFGDDSDRYLVLAFRGEQCTACRWQLYYPNLLTYFFENENDMIFGTIETNKAGRFATFCDVDPESAKLEVRLITKGGTRCLQHLESESLIDFVTESTGKIAKKSYVNFHNHATYDKLIANKQVSHFIEVMSPFERSCYDFSIEIEKAAEAFSMEPSIDFNRIDCSLAGDLCEDLHVANVPGMLFIPAEGVAYNNTYPRLPSADSIILFVNELIGTHRVIDGGLDEEYGRDPTLDELAYKFIYAPAKERRAIMKRVKKERKLYLNTGIYYLAMKEIIANGTDVIFDRVKTTAYALNDLDVTDLKYAPTAAKLNILHQFEIIEPSRSIIMSTQNVDRVLNGERNVMVLFYDARCPVCRDFSEVYREAFDKHPLSVYFAAVNAARYETLRIRFNITDHPQLKYFRAGEPLANAKDIPERTVDGIVEWLNNELAEAAMEKKEKEEKEAAELASQLDDDEDVDEVNVDEVETAAEDAKAEQEPVKEAEKEAEKEAVKEAEKEAEKSEEEL